MTRETFLEKLAAQPSVMESVTIDSVQLVPRSNDTYQDGDIITLPKLDDLLLYKNKNLNGAVFFAAEEKNRGLIQFYPTAFQKMRITASKMADGTIVNGEVKRASGNVVDAWQQSASLKDFLTKFGGKTLSVKLSEPFETRAFDSVTKKAVRRPWPVPTIPTFNWVEA